MLSFEFTDINGKIIKLNNPIYIVINRDENVPADDLSVVFPMLKDVDELCDVEVYDGSEIAFKGIVDEQQTILSEKEYYTKITARSMAAMLLDNESRPICYTDVCASVIFERHLKPNLISGYKADETVLKGDYNISKGTTDWQAFAAFCIKAFNKIPRIEPDGTANFNGVESEEKITFSNTNGIKYNSIKENIKRCKLISDVIIKPMKSDNYNTVINNSFSKSRKINRRRYIDIFSEKDYDTADMILKNSEKNAFELTVVSPLCLINKLGAEVKVEDDIIGEKDGLYVSGINYCLTPEKEETTLSLKKVI